MRQIIRIPNMNRRVVIIHKTSNVRQFIRIKNECKNNKHKKHQQRQIIRDPKMNNKTINLQKHQQRKIPRDP